MKNIISVFLVTDLKTNKSFREFIQGYGQLPIRMLRKKYPKHTRFVLEGFEIGGNFYHLFS